MPIAEMTEGGPRVESHVRGVAIWADDPTPADPADPVLGFLLPPHIAAVTALRMLAEVNKLDPESVAMLQLRSITGSRVQELPDAAPYARIDIELDHVTLPLFLDRAILAQLVGDMAALLADLR